MTQASFREQKRGKGGKKKVGRTGRKKEKGRAREEGREGRWECQIGQGTGQAEPPRVVALPHGGLLHVGRLWARKQPDCCYSQPHSQMPRGFHLRELRFPPPCPPGESEGVGSLEASVSQVSLAEVWQDNADREALPSQGT